MNCLNMDRYQENAWLAALMDGEGHFNLQRRASYTHISIRIAQKYSDKLLFNIKNILGYGEVDSGIQWRVDNHEGVTDFLNRVGPYLIVKQDQAYLVRAIISTFVAQGHHPTLQQLVYRERIMELWENRPEARKVRKLKR